MKQTKYETLSPNPRCTGFVPYELWVHGSKKEHSLKRCTYCTSGCVVYTRLNCLLVQVTKHEGGSSSIGVNKALVSCRKLKTFSIESILCCPLFCSAPPTPSPPPPHIVPQLPDMKSGRFFHAAAAQW
jgi:hypothetical protein